MDFLNSTCSNRIYIINSDKNSIHIYELLSKHLREPIDSLKSKYKIELNTIRRRIEVDGSNEDIYELFQYLVRLNLKFESITPLHLRIDLYEFINKVI